MVSLGTESQRDVHWQLLNILILQLFMLSQLSPQHI